MKLPLKLLCISFLLSACASEAYKVFDDKEVPLSQRIHVKAIQNGDHTFWQGLNEKFFITSVDDQRTSPILSPLQYPTEVEVLPGKHTLDVRYQHMNLLGSISVWFIANAGHTYSIKGGADGYKFVAFVVDDATGKPTGGIKGSLDEPK